MIHVVKLLVQIVTVLDCILLGQVSLFFEPDQVTPTGMILGAQLLSPLKLERLAHLVLIRIVTGLLWHHER